MEYIELCEVDAGTPYLWMVHSTDCVRSESKAVAVVFNVWNSVSKRRPVAKKMTDTGGAARWSNLGSI